MLLNKGTVNFWTQDHNNPKGILFGWGFIIPDGCNGAAHRIYFNETRLPERVTVKRGDRVEFALFKPNGKYTSLAAKKVEKIDDKNSTGNNPRPKSHPLHQTHREEVTTLPGEADT